MRLALGFPVDRCRPRGVEERLLGLRVDPVSARIGTSTRGEAFTVAGLAGLEEGIRVNKAEGGARLGIYELV